MSPEPLYWDRRDFRKHGRSTPDARLGAGGGPHKWRHQQHDPHAPPPYHHRWYSDFRSTRLLPPGHSKQGGWPMYSDDAGQGFTPLGSPFADRNLERPFGSCGDGRYIRSNRENRSSLTQKDWRAPSWESAALPNSLGEPMTEVNNLKSMETSQECHDHSSKSSYAFHPLGPVTQSDRSHSRSPTQPIEEKNGGTMDKTIDKGQESEKENCLAPDWEPLKWSWVGNLSTRNMCNGHSTSSKSLGLDSVKVLAEVQPKNATLDQSPSVYVACVRSNAPAQSEKTGSRKKPRLGWGEGLAKYEKKRVEGPEEGTSKNEPALSSISTESLSANLLERSPRVESLFHCASPATPSSVACSSSPGCVDEKSAMEVNANSGNTNLNCSPHIASPAHYDGPTLDLENLELESIANLSSLIHKLQQSSYSSSPETGYLQTTSINKLLLWKVDTLKALEKTESEIESLETELKSLKSETAIYCSHPAGPRSSQIVSSRESTVRDVPVGLEGGHVLSTDEDIDSPVSAMPKFVGVLPASFLSERTEFSEGARNADVDNSGGLDEKCLKEVCSSQECPGYVDNLVSIGNTSLDDLVGSNKLQCNVDNLCSSILSSNRVAASRASQQLNKLLPKKCLFDGSIESVVSSSQRKSSVVRERFLKRKQFVQFKEKVLTLKLKVFQHFWKEGRLVSIRRLRGKTQKKFDPGRNVQKRNRSQVSFYAGGPRAVCADEVIRFVNALLSELALKPYRNTLKMPALVLDKQLKMSRFISSNGLVEDPCGVEKERSMMNPWTAEEKYIFIEKLAAFGKDFRKIASFLDHKTVADCIEFYYKNHKSECFQKTRKDSGFMKQRKSQTTTYLVASGKRRNPELNAASLDILGAASEIMANIDDVMDSRQKCTSRSSFGASSSCAAPMVFADHPLKGSDSMDTDNDERETVAADVLVGICRTLSSEAVSSSTTSSGDLGGGFRDPSCVSINSTKQPLTPEFTQDVDAECWNESSSELNPTDWSDGEKSIFIRAVSSYGKNFAMVSHSVGTKSTDQCKVFFSKARKCLGLDRFQPVAGTASDDDDDDGGGNESDMVKTSNGSNRQGTVDAMIAELVPENSSLIQDVDDERVTQRDRGQNRTDISFASVQTVTVASKVQSEQGIEEEDDVGLPNGSNEVENRLLVTVSGGHRAEEDQCQEPLSPEEDDMPSVDAHSYTLTHEKSDNPNEADIGTCSTERSRVSSLLQNDHLASGTSTQFSVPLTYKDSRNRNPPLPNDGCGIDDDKHSQNFVSTSYSFPNSTESSQILHGYPVSLHTMVGEVNGDASCKNLNFERCTDFLHQKCKETRQSNAAFPPLEGVRDHSRPQTGCSNPPKNGDVKLFGKILSSSQQKPCDSVDDHRIHVELLNLRLGSAQKVSLDNILQPNLDENMPVRRVGFWDGNTGIPDSALLLAKYPAAFSGFALPSKNGESPVDSAPDHQGLRNGDDVFVEMQRRNVYNVASGLHAARGRGGQFSGVSDPVAAIKMHYAQLRMQGDKDSWIGYKDLGR